MKQIAIAIALGAALWAPSAAAGTAAGNFNVNITLFPAGSPPPPGVTPAPSSADICVSQTLSGVTGGVVRVLCRSGQFVSIDPRPGASDYVGLHGGTYRHYFGNVVPISLQYLGGSQPWVGPGTVTSIHLNYPEGLGGFVEMQVGF